MKALVKKKSEPGLWLEEVPKPSIGLNDVLIHIDRTGIAAPICTFTNGTRGLKRLFRCQWLFGHEFVGEIVEVGSNVKDFFPVRSLAEKGHVVLWPLPQLPGRPPPSLCRHEGRGCKSTRRFRRVPSIARHNVWVHGNGINRDIASIFDPFGNAVHTALSFPVLGEDVLITGRRPHWHNGCRSCATRRSEVRCHHGCERLPTRTGAQNGSDLGRESSR